MTANELKKWLEELPPEDRDLDVVFYEDGLAVDVEDPRIINIPKHDFLIQAKEDRTRVILL